jgi:transmembrane protein 18
MGEATASGESLVVGRAVEECTRSTLNKHVDVVIELFDRVSTELCSGLAPSS